MKKLFVTLLAVLLLAGCGQVSPEQTTAPTTEPTTRSTTEPTTKPTTAPTTVPTTAPMVPTTEAPTTPIRPLESTEPSTDDSPSVTRIPFVFSKDIISMLGKYQLPGRSELMEGYLYLADIEANQIYLITDKPIYADPAISGGDFKGWSYHDDLVHIVYVLEDEPNKLYCTLIEDITQQTVIYESKAGPITDLRVGPYQHLGKALQWIEGHRQYVWFDIPTATAEIRLELPYMLRAGVDSQNSTVIDGERCLRDESKILVWGKLREGDEMGTYIYDRETESFKESPY